MDEVVTPQPFDMEAFQEQVLACIPVLERPTPDLMRGGAASSSDREVLEQLLPEEFGRERARSELAVFAVSGDMTPSAKAYLGKRISEIVSAREQSNEVINRWDFKHHACAALTSLLSRAPVGQSL